MSKVLLIEDDDIMRMAIGNILKREGFEIVVAKDGLEAFDKLDNEEYDLVITDLMMPHATGFDMVSRLRSKLDKTHVGIIICSSINNKETVAEAYKLGADYYMEKPVIPSELITRVGMLLSVENGRAQLMAQAV
jgi:two-component system response regulator VicR